MRAAWVCLWSAAACGAPEVFEAEEAAHFEIATGLAELVPLEEGAEIALYAGPQGGGRRYGFHMYLGVYARGVEPGEANLSWNVYDPELGEELARASYRAHLTAVGDGVGAWGMRAIFSDCCAAENRALEIRLAAIDRSGLTHATERFAHALECPGGLPDPTVDPCP